jgi:hypothetical protein
VGGRICGLDRHGIFHVSMILSDLPSPAEAGFAKAENRFPLLGSCSN